MKGTKLLIALGILAGVIILTFFAGYCSTNQAPASAGRSATVANSNIAAAPQGEPFFFFDLFGVKQTAETEVITAWHIVVRLTLAVLLAGLLAFRPRKNVPLINRNLYVAQTQILLAVVAAALMMIVGDNAARAFAIFAAVSLVRFRTNIRDPKEITVLLISLALGLAAGVGRWELGAVLCLFALALLWLLEYNEPEKVFRSMDLTIKTRDIERTQEMMKKIFQRHKLEAEVRSIEPPDEAQPVGAIVYYLNLRLSVGTDYLSERILEADPETVEGIQWAQNKAGVTTYQ
jgi:uncharacterized membrane protein YhiD involved in acid resistance